MTDERKYNRQVFADIDAALHALQADGTLSRADLAELLRACRGRIEKIERDLSELVTASLAYDAAILSCANNPDGMASFCTAEGDTLDTLYGEFVSKANAAKATLESSDTQPTRIERLEQTLRKVRELLTPTGTGIKYASARDLIDEALDG